jgi:hypothetical protein
MMSLGTGGELSRKLRPTPGCDAKEEEDRIVYLEPHLCHFHGKLGIYKDVQVLCRQL